MLSSFDFIVIYLLLFVIFIIWGYNARNFTNNSYYTSSILPILCYSVIEGARYGRGADYLGYKTRFEHPTLTNEDQIFFKWLNMILRNMGFNYIGAYIIYSLIFIICLVILTKEYKKYTFEISVFFLPATILFSESFIRQAIGFSFVFLAIKYFYNKKWIYLGISIITSALIHSSNIITLIIIGTLYFIKQPIPVYLSILTYLFFSYIFDMSKVSVIANYFNSSNFALDSHFQGYIDNADSWFSEDAIASIYEQSTLTKTFRTFFDVSIIIVGYYSLTVKRNNKILPVYTTFIFGAIFYKAFFNIEILRRIAEPLYLFWFIIVGYSFYTIRSYKKNIFWPNFASYIIIIYIIAFWGRFIFLNPEARFVWNYIK